MREDIASLTTSLRRYAHALLGRWPARDARAGGRRADQDADDLAQEALLGFWRAGLLPRDEAKAAQPPGALRLALLRCMTALAREFLRRDEDAEGLLSGARDAPPRRGARHFPWSPEARALPRLAFESRALLALAALERLDYDDIGAVLDMSAGQALAKLACARAQLASEIAGVREPHLRAAVGVCDAELHGYADDLLERGRRAEIAALLEWDAEAARRVDGLRRGAERLRGAFATLEAEPLPATLNFDPPAPVRRRPLKRRRSGLLAWLAGGGRPPAHAH
jgi:DNA-directed RNA polymerase specialized sigma24 family protein